MQLWQIATHFNKQPDQLSAKISAILMFPMFILVLWGAYGQFRLQKFGFILYYIQFPLRLYLWVFSVGFITLLPEALSYYGDKWFGVLLKVCIMFEFVRLYLTIRGQVKLKDLQ
ncbi:hypothetical protein VRU48_16245 [Pedobacter sp. KR3-3]|uniref:Uncharacterized protein n=1 Tax=Pedobacter albus TaxID=3113905 RepID=A0ABU7IBL1_9SPHI|nr:hypothetical protein [Pedobacter sp. KR3-3]MEE1946676.1 hypothetical protein [Pedobacter sp. KR3-3]